MRINRYHKIVINIFLKERTIQKTIVELAKLSGEPYKTDTFVRKIVKNYQKSSLR